MKSGVNNSNDDDVEDIFDFNVDFKNLFESAEIPTNLLAVNNFIPVNTNAVNNLISNNINMANNLVSVPKIYVDPMLVKYARNGKMHAKQGGMQPTLKNDTPQAIAYRAAYYAFRGTDAEQGIRKAAHMGYSAAAKDCHKPEKEALKIKHGFSDDEVDEYLHRFDDYRLRHPSTKSKRKKQHSPIQSAQISYETSSIQSDPMATRRASDLMAQNSVELMVNHNTNNSAQNSDVNLNGILDMPPNHYLINPVFSPVGNNILPGQNITGKKRNLFR